MADAPRRARTRSRAAADAAGRGGADVLPPNQAGLGGDDDAPNPPELGAAGGNKRRRTVAAGPAAPSAIAGDDGDVPGPATTPSSRAMEGPSDAVDGAVEGAAETLLGADVDADDEGDAPADAAGPSATIFSTFESDKEVFPLEVPANRRAVILGCLSVVWGMATPRPFQVFIIFCMVYLTGQLIYLIRKTGEGKSLVILGTAAMLRGVTIVMVPLIGLGSDQVNKSVRLGERVEAYHVDENKGDDFILLAKRLVGMRTRADGRAYSSVILFCSPQSLDPTSPFSKALRALAKRNLITSIFVDEAHAIHREGMRGSNFRPEFDSAFTSLVDIAKTQNTPPNLCIMSASLTQPYQDTISTITKRKPSLVCWGDMARRSIYFGVQVIGQPSAAIKRQLALDYAKYPGRKVLIYTNSKTNAETTLTSAAESVLESTPAANGEVVALTGDCGIMMKSMLMKAFCGEGDVGEDEGEGADPTHALPNILVMPCTSAANCGVSSNDCFRALRYSMPPNVIDVLQEMGRVDRGHDAERGDHRYEVYLSFNVVMNLFLRILQNTSKTVRDYELGELMLVLRFLVLPTDCYHVFLEEHFERPCDDAIRHVCGDNCTFCTGGHRAFTKEFDRQALINTLTCAVFGDGKCSLPQFLKRLTENALTIYGGDEAFVKKEVEPGNIHALALQLVAAKFVEVFVENERVVGTAKMNKGDMYVRLAKADCGSRWLMCNEAIWDHHKFNYK